MKKLLLVLILAVFFISCEKQETGFLKNIEYKGTTGSYVVEYTDGVSLHTDTVTNSYFLKKFKAQDYFIPFFRIVENLSNNPVSIKITENKKVIYEQTK